MHVPPDQMSDVTGHRENRGDDNLVSQGQTVSFVFLTIRLYNYAACHSPGVKMFWKTVTQTLCFIYGKVINTTHHELKYDEFLVPVFKAAFAAFHGCALSRLIR